jgi:hypothetical protein
MPTEIALLLGLSRIGVLLVGLGTLFVLGFGLWLVELGDWGYGAGWIDAALGLLAAIVVLGALGGRRPAGAQARRPSRGRRSTGERGAADVARRPRDPRRQLPLGAAPARDRRTDGVQAGRSPFQADSTGSTAGHVLLRVRGCLRGFKMPVRRIRGG